MDGASVYLVRATMDSSRFTGLDAAFRFDAGPSNVSFVTVHPFRSSILHDDVVTRTTLSLEIEVGVVSSSMEVETKCPRSGPPRMFDASSGALIHPCDPRAPCPSRGPMVIAGSRTLCETALLRDWGTLPFPDGTTLTTARRSGDRFLGVASDGDALVLYEITDDGAFTERYRYAPAPEQFEGHPISFSGMKLAADGTLYRFGKLDDRGTAGDTVVFAFDDKRATPVTDVFGWSTYVFLATGP